MLLTDVNKWEIIKKITIFANCKLIKFIKMRIKVFSIILLLFIIFNKSFSADYSVAVRDTLMPHGAIYEIPIFGKINDANAKNIELHINFNALILDIKSARGGEQFGIKDASIDLNTVADKWDSVNITINSSNISPDFEGILCYLLVEALAGPDTISIVKPFQLKVNGTAVVADFESGFIRTSPPIVSQKYIEGIGLLYPNPFAESATVKFTIEKESKVRFLVYSTSGKFIDELPENTKYFEFDIFNSKNERLTEFDNVKFEPGNYSLVLRPLKWEVSSGMYCVFMLTASGEYSTQFIYVK